MAVVDGNDELGRNESSGVALLSSKEIADPVVYKLVRVDVDGRIISATDDDVVEVDDLLEEDKSELLPIVADTRQAKECILNEAGVLPVRNNLLGSEGISNNVEVKLQELKAPLEETVPIVPHGVNGNSTTQVGVEMCMKPSGFLKICGPSSLASATCSSSMLRISNNADVKVHKLKALLEESAPLVSHGVNDKCNTQLGVEMCMKPAGFLKIFGPSSLASVTCSSSMLGVSNSAEVLPASDPSSQETVPLVSHGVNDKFATQAGVEMCLKPTRFLKICGPSSLASVTCSSSMSGVSNSAEVKVQKLKSSLEETVPLVSPGVNDKCTTHVQGETCLKPADALRISESSSSASASCSSSIPDFSKIKGEICLDNLSVKELHETFRATFGRATTVKDKLWLKRRIAMGLTNSCDVATSTFTIKDKTLIRREKIEGGAPCEIKCSKSADQVDGIFKGSHKDSPITPANKVGDEQVSGKRLRKSDAEDEYICEDPHNEHTKRVRKPTKRYIEELSKDDNSECSVKPVPSVKSSGNCQSDPKPPVKPGQSVGLERPAVVTRQESFGGSGVQVPYVSRVRRGRPRENFMPLMKFHPGSMGVDAKPVTKTLDECVSLPDNENDLKAKLAPQQSEQPIAAEQKKEEEDDKENHNDVKTCISVEQQVEMENLDVAEDNSDHNLRTQSTTKGEPIRKHHRAWTLSEVTQLVEGVARFGAGRWSEIKKLSFTSYSYRTSVDLKDKWRNLLRASYAPPPAVRDMLNSKKQASAALPAHILLRVRELAEKHSQGPPPDLARKVGNMRGRKPGGGAGIFGRKIVGGVGKSHKVRGVGGVVSAGSKPIVNETRSGFL
ncbi:uncharacterized protein LOC113294341 [Papaver somniferum]|uniref:uncharacterized protein LOC113294341 n=1 Tax=Papaver somniferum TaxID=3469 RepID=UPI000E6FC7CB|nr:uncharacterized protein LOC113294341 [Papaver somniferum]